MRSRYCRCVHLGDDKATKPYLLYSSLSGQVTLVDDLCYEILHQKAGTPDPILTEKQAITSRTTILRDRGFLIDSIEEETGRVNQLVTLVLNSRRNALQTIILFSPGKRHSSSKEATVKRMAATFMQLVEAYPAELYYIRFWIFESFQSRLLEIFTSTLKNLLDALPAGSKRPTIYFVVDTHGQLPFKARLLRELSEGRTLLRIFIDRWFMGRAASEEAYQKQLFRTITAMTQQGLMTQLYFNVNSGFEDFFMDHMLEQAMIQGFSSMVSRFFLCPLLPKNRIEDFFCELDGVDWEVLKRIIEKSGRDPKYRLFTLYGAGVISKFQNLLDEKKNLLPDIHFCPTIANSLTLTLDGRILVCPKSGFVEGTQPPVEPVGRFLPELTFNERELVNWWGRNVVTIPGCTQCPDTFICGGGCALEAYRRTGSIAAASCQPVVTVLTQGVGTHIAHITRHFGPEERQAK